MQFRISQKPNLLHVNLKCFRCSFSVTLGTDLTAVCISVLVCKMMLTAVPILWSCKNLIICVKCSDEYLAHSKHSINASCYYHCLKFHVLEFLVCICDLLLYFSMLEFSVSGLYLDTLNSLRAFLITVSAPPTFTSQRSDCSTFRCYLLWLFFFQLQLSFTILMTKVTLGA